MSRKIIAVDADDTLFDENTAVRLFMNDTYGFTHTEEDYRVTGPFLNYWERIWGLDVAETTAKYEEFVTSSYKQDLQPLAGALGVIEKLKKDYDLVIVTSRDHRTVDITHASVEKYYSDIFQDIHFVPLWGGSEKATKAKICKEIGAQYLIDDSFEHCHLAAEEDIQAILFGDYGWNRTQSLSDAMIRCSDWFAIGDYFNLKGNI